MGIKVIVHATKGYVTRIYAEGHDHNLPAWEEEITEDFDDIIRHFEDDPERCKLVGEARWLWMRITKSNFAQIKNREKRGFEPVTDSGAVGPTNQSPLPSRWTALT